MAKATDRSTLLTTLVIGQVEVPVALFSATVDKPGKLAEFDTAGPNGGKLVARAVARPVPVERVPTDEEPAGVIGDPLGDDKALPSEVAERLSAVVDSATADDPALAARLDAMRERVEASIPEPDVPGAYGRELVEEGSDVVVAPQDVRRGVRLEDGRFIDCTEQLAKIEERTRLDKIEVIGFIDGTQIPRTRVKATKYLGAADESAPHALRIIFEGLKSKRRMAIVKLTKRSRQTLGAIGAASGVLVLLELVWAEDIREPPARVKVIRQAAVHEREVAMFEQLIDAMAFGPAAIETLRDDAIAEREVLKAQALAGKLPSAVVDAEVVDEADELAAQLAASLAAVNA